MPNGADGMAYNSWILSRKSFASAIAWSYCPRIIDFGGGKQAAIHHFGGDCPFMTAVQYESGSAKVRKVESNFFASFIERLVEFFETGVPPVDREETIAVVTVIEYGLKAAATPYRWIDLPGTG